MIVEEYDFGNGLGLGVMGGDAIMNAHRKEERQKRREAIMKAREQDDSIRNPDNGNYTD